MQLDLLGNELIFSQVGNPKVFEEALQRGKGLKYRRYNNHFYVSLAYLDVTRQVLREFASQMRVTIRYEKFAHLFITNKNPLHIRWYPSVCEVSGQGMPWDVIIPGSSYFTKAALQSKAYERGQWDGLIHLFDVLNGKFPSGLLERLLQALNERGIPYTIEQMFSYPAPRFQLHPVFEFTPTEDQIEAVEALDRANNGIAKLPTGFGKTSYVAAALIAKKGVKSMFLANQRVLINDAKDDFQKVFANDDVKIGTIGDGEFDPGDITVASIQGVVAAMSPPSPQEVQQVTQDIYRAERAVQEATDPSEISKAKQRLTKTQNKLKKMQWRKDRSHLIREFLESVELFIVDESQVLGTDMWNQFLHACPAPYRYTLSATDTRTDGGRVQIIAATGERRYESSAAEQIEKGRLAEFLAHFKKFDHGLDKDLMKQLTIDYHQAYRIFIINNQLRNEHLCNKVMEWAKQGYSVLGLVTILEHADIVYRILMDKGMPEHLMEIVHGQTPKKTRQEHIRRFRAGEFPILLGSSIFDVGFNAKNASKMVRFNAGGSEVREPQRAGRTVRKRDDGSIGESYDILDVNCPFFESQSWKRIKILKEEFGHHRVKIQPGIIEGELDIISLRDMVAETPDETDREKGQQILDELLRRKEIQHFDGPGFDTKGIEDDPDLASLLAELKFEM